MDLKNVSAKTWVRTLILIIALVNQAMVTMGMNPIPFSDEELYSAATMVVTAASAIWAWWSNNSFTAAAQEAGIPFCADSVGGMFGLYFLPEIPHGFADVMKADTDMFNRFFHGMLQRGVYFAPSTFEAGFVSIMHTDDVIDATVAAARETFAEIAK